MAVAFDSMTKAIAMCQETIKTSSDVRSEIRVAMSETPEVFDHARALADKARIVYNDPLIDPTDKPAHIRTDFFALAMELRPLIGEMHTADNNMRAMAPRELNDLRWAICVVTLCGLGASAGVSMWAARILFRNFVLRLDTIQHNAQRVAMGKELLPTPPGVDEIADLDVAFRNAAEIIADARKREFAILEQSFDVLFSLDKSYRVIAVGDSAVKSWFYKPDEIIGRSLITLMHDDDAPFAVQTLELAARSEKEQQFEGKIKCGDGSTKDTRLSVAWQNSAKSFYCVAHDVSERREVERRKQQLIATASGELASPLDAVSQTIAELSSEHAAELSEKLSKMMRRAESNLDRLTRLIGDLLDMERMQSDKIELNLSRVSARRVCETASEAVNALAQRMGVPIEMADGVDIDMLADKPRLEQIMVNLISNAIKFSPKGKAVNLSVQSLDEFVEVSVADSGPGIEAAECDLIFEKFYQAKAEAASNEVKSTGLGLTICKVLVEAHGGAIGVESEVGRGSRFWIRIPRFDARQEESK